MTDLDSLPDPIRRRLAFGLTPAETQIDNVKQTGFARLREYEALVKRASAGESVDESELLDAAARVGRGPARAIADIEVAHVAWLAWQSSFNPT